MTYALNLVLILICSASLAEMAGALINYETLDQHIQIMTLRAGGHDAEGSNEYYFKVQMVGLINDKEQRRLDFEDRKKLLIEVGNFANLKIPSLQYLDIEKNKKNIIFLLKGDQIRDLSAKFMRKYNLIEDDVAIKVIIEMWEKNKKYIFLPDDKKIAETSYFPIPYKPTDKPLRQDQALKISDKLGTQISFSINYIYNKPKTDESS